jgi:hypothetical protein
MVIVVKTQRIFFKHFNVVRHGKVPCCNTVQLWVENLRTDTSTLKKKPLGSVRTMRSPQNIEDEAVIHKDP